MLSYSGIAQQNTKETFEHILLVNAYATLGKSNSEGWLCKRPYTENFNSLHSFSDFIENTLITMFDDTFLNTFLNKNSSEEGSSNPQGSGKIIGTELFLTDNDIKFMYEQWVENQRKWNNWKHLKIDKEYLTKCSKERSAKLSVPVYSIDKTIGLIVFHGKSSKSIFFFKKIDNEWKFFCGGWKVLND